MILRRLLTEIFQILGNYVADMAKYASAEEAVKIRAAFNSIPAQILEDRSYGAVRLQIDIDYILVVLLPEIQQDESLAHLPCAVEQQRPTAWTGIRSNSSK